jgi:hypothetical protein
MKRLVVRLLIVVVAFVVVRRLRDAEDSTFA